MDSPGAINTIYFLLIGSLGMVLMACAAIFFFIIYYRRNIRAKEEVHSLEIHHRQQIIYSNLRTLEYERKRFAEDLHDEIGASLSTIRLHVSRHEVDHENTPTGDMLTEVKSIIDLSMASTRRISHNILPPGLKMLGLSHVVEDLCSNISRGGVTATAAIPQQLPGLGYDRQLTLYRIIQELLNNAIKHSDATTINIQLAPANQSFILFYKDNGKGFDAEKTKFAGLGLSNIQSRAEMVDGSFHILTSPGNGLSVEIRIPMET